MRLAGVVANACVLGGCSLGALNGFSGGGSDVDAGPGGPVIDAAIATDGGPSNDAAAERADDAASGSFCTSLVPAPTACADFDDGTLHPLLPNGSSGKCTATIEPVGVGGTKGVRFVIPGSAGASDAACLRMTIPSGKASVLVEMDARVTQIGTDDFDIVVLSANNLFELGFRAGALGKLEIEEDDGTNAYYPSSKSLDATYRHLKFVVTRTAGGASTELFYDGASAVAHVGDPRSIDDATVLEIGDCYANTSRGWTVEIDNLVVDVK